MGYEYENPYPAGYRYGYEYHFGTGYKYEYRTFVRIYKLCKIFPIHF